MSFRNLESYGIKVSRRISWKSDILSKNEKAKRAKVDRIKGKSEIRF